MRITEDIQILPAQAQELDEFILRKYKEMYDLWALEEEENINKLLSMSYPISEEYNEYCNEF